MPTVELNMLGRLWFDAYNESLSRYTASAGRDVGSYCEAAYQLKSFWERCPEQGSLVRRMALSQMNFALTQAPWAAVALLGETALRASLAHPLENESEAGAIRELLLAQSCVYERRLFEGLDHLQSCNSCVASIASTPFGRWVSARANMLHADLLVASFELDVARNYYREAHEYATSLVADDDDLSTFCRLWVELATPAGLDTSDDAVFRQLAANPRWDTKFIALNSLQSAAAIDRNSGQFGDIAAVRDGFTHLGRVQLVRPLLWTQALASLPNQERKAICDLFRDMAENRNIYFFEARGDQPPPREFMERADPLRDPDEANTIEIGVVERLAGIEAYLACKDYPSAREAWYEQIRDIVETKMSFPTLYAFGQQLRFSLGMANEEEMHSFQQFLQCLGGVVYENHELLVDSQYRTMLDPAIEAATIYAVDNIDTDTSDTTAASALISLRRSPVVTQFPRLIGFPEAKRTTCEQGIEILADTLKRIRWAMSKRDEDVVLISQKRDVGMALIFCSSDDEPLRVINAGQAFVDAMTLLDQAAIYAEDSSLSSAHDEVEKTGRQAFNALPHYVRDAIRKRKTIFFVPDYGAGHDKLPFELIHDGQGYLLSQVVIARFTSLEHLAETLEGRSSTPGKRRALVLGFAQTKGHDPLPLAADESKNVHTILKSVGFDVPEIKDERVTSRFITDRLSFVDVFHVSGHGESAVGTERLFLPDGGWLDTMDLERNPQSSLPFVYLNTCELGEARFLGGGRGRGLAYTLAELGAPAILAHTAKVFDDVSSEMATTFYRETLKHPVGEALRHARKSLLAKYPAAEVGRLVLLGNPAHELLVGAEANRNDDLTGVLLDKYFDLEASQLQRSEVLTYMLNYGRQGGPKLQAAAHLIMSREEAMHANEENNPTRLSDAVALAEALHHRPSCTLFKYKLAMLSVKAGHPDALNQLRAALRDLSVLARTDSRWEPNRASALAMLQRLELEQRGINIGKLEKSSKETPDMLRGFVSSVIGTEDLWGTEAATLRNFEDSVKDFVWNAIVAGQGNRFEAVPEKINFTSGWVERLVNKGYLAEEARDFATPILVAVLSRAWAYQNEEWSPKHCAAAQAQLLEALLEEVRLLWSPPQKQLREIVNTVCDALESALENLDKAGRSGGYEILDSEMTPVRTLAEQAIEQVAKSYPDAKDSCLAYLAGCFISKNRFDAAFQDHYVAEKLSSTFEELSSYLTELMDKACGTREFADEDELVRWHNESSS